MDYPAHETAANSGSEENARTITWQSAADISEIIQRTELAKLLSRNSANSSVVQADGDNTEMVGYRSELGHV